LNLDSHRFEFRTFRFLVLASLLLSPQCFPLANTAYPTPIVSYRSPSRVVIGVAAAQTSSYSLSLNTLSLPSLHSLPLSCSQPFSHSHTRSNTLSISTRARRMRLLSFFLAALFFAAPSLARSHLQTNRRHARLSDPTLSLVESRLAETATDTQVLSLTSSYSRSKLTSYPQKQVGQWHTRRSPTRTLLSLPLSLLPFL